MDVLLVDQHGKILGRPWLTTVIDSYSRCIMGINLGYDAPSSQVVALALRHAILTKQYGSEYGLHEEWVTSEQILKLPVASNLSSQTMLKTLGEATGGYIGLMDMILRETAIRALKKGLQKIDLETLKQVAGEYK